MLGIILLICLVVFWIFRYASFRLTNEASDRGAELDSFGRRFEVNTKAVRYHAYSIIAMLVGAVSSVSPYIFLEGDKSEGYLVGLGMGGFVVVMMVWGLWLTIRESKGSFWVSDKEIEVNGRKSFKLSVSDIKKIRRNGGRFNIFLKEKGDKPISFNINGYSNQKELFELIKQLRHHIAVLNGDENSFGHKMTSIGFARLNQGWLVTGVINLMIWTVLVYAAICCIDHDYNKKDHYKEFNAIGYDASQKENAWDYYAEAENKYIDLEEEFRDELSEKRRSKDYTLTNEKEMLLLNWFDDNKEVYKLVKQVGAVDYCYAEYDPNKDSESYVKVEKTHRFIKGYFEILDFGYYSGAFDIELAELFKMRLAAAKHINNSREVIYQLISYGFIGRSLDLIERSEIGETTEIDKLREIVAMYFPDGVPEVDYRGEMIMMYGGYGKLQNVPFALPYNTPLSFVYMACGSPSIYEYWTREMYKDIEYKVKNRIEIVDVSLYKFPFMRGVYTNILSKALARAYFMSLRADSSISAFDIIFELEEYKIKMGEYPAVINELYDAGFGAVMPDDVDSGGKLVYDNDGERAVLYGVGDNGKDNGGCYESLEKDKGMDDVIYWQKEVGGSDGIAKGR